HRVAEARVETAPELRQRALRPQICGRQDRRRVRRDVTEDWMQVVDGRQELAHLERTPRALESDERFAAGQTGARAVARVAGNVRFDLEDGVQSATQRFRAANADTRRV